MAVIWIVRSGGNALAKLRNTQAEVRRTQRSNTLVSVLPSKDGGRARALTRLPNLFSAADADPVVLRARVAVAAGTDLRVDDEPVGGDDVETERTPG